MFRVTGICGMFMICVLSRTPFLLHGRVPMRDREKESMDFEKLMARGNSMRRISILTVRWRDIPKLNFWISCDRWESCTGVERLVGISLSINPVLSLLPIRNLFAVIRQRSHLILIFWLSHTKGNRWLSPWPHLYGGFCLLWSPHHSQCTYDDLYANLSKSCFFTTDIFFPAQCESKSALMIMSFNHKDLGDKDFIRMW